MKEEFKELARYRIEKAKDTLNDSKVYDARHESDYKDFKEFSNEEIEKWLKNAQDLIDIIETIVKMKFEK